MEHVEDLLKKTESIKTPNEVQHIVVHLGTNDVSRHSEDAGQVIIEYTIGLNTIREKFPKAEISLVSVPPRKGRSEGVAIRNEVSLTLNRYIERLAASDSALHYVDTYPMLTDANGSPIKKFYDKRDPTGVHFNQEGKNLLKKVFLQAMNVDENAVDSKRKQEFATPPSTEKSSKVKR